MGSPSGPHEQSQAWIKTIEEGKGYQAPDPLIFRKIIRRMRTYEFFRAVLRHTHIGESVLEAGCGWATTSFALAERGISVTALDISSQLIADLRLLQAKIGDPFMKNFTAVVGDIFLLPELHTIFDVVVSDGTYEHFLEGNDRRKILKNMSAVLTKNGKCIVAVPNLRNPFFHFVVDEKMPAMHPFSLKNLAMELEQGGFCVLETGYSFVNPGFEQWIKARWMVWPIHFVSTVFGFLPRPLKALVAAHVYCVAQKYEPVA